MNAKPVVFSLEKLFSGFVISLATLVTFLNAGMAVDEKKPLTDEEKSLLIKSVFQPVARTIDLPTGVRTILGLGIQPKSMAEPNESFTVGCVGDANRPRARFLFGGKSSERFLVFFEKGGYAHYYVLQFFTISGNKATMIHQWTLQKAYKSSDEIKSALDKNELR
jgi:hypothetical protein